LAALGEVQSTLRYSRKLAALGRLTAGVAHEVKNPLNAMTIHLELLRSKLTAARARVAAGVGGPSAAAADDAALEHVSVIGSEIKRLDQVVQGFLKFMRAEDLKLRPVDVRELLEGIARVVEPDAAASHIRVICEQPSQAPFVQGDPEALRQALLNLALNACQAMPDGGTLRLTSKVLSGRRVAITVEDTGVGIATADLPRIFDLYFTTKPGGSGIGLSMVYRTVQRHDGEIEVQSTPGTGTTVRMVLPEAGGGSPVRGRRGRATSAHSGLSPGRHGTRSRLGRSASAMAPAWAARRGQVRSARRPPLAVPGPRPRISLPPDPALPAVAEVPESLVESPPPRPSRPAGARAEAGRTGDGARVSDSEAGERAVDGASAAGRKPAGAEPEDAADLELRRQLQR